MRSSRENARQTVFDLVLSGADQQMRAGDSFGIWTFNEIPHFDYPKQDWDPERASDLANRAAIFLRDQRYEKKAQLDPLLVKLNSVIEAVGDLNVLLISCGEPAMRGTTFDDRVNAEYERRANERRKAKKPFVTIIVVREGRIIGTSVTLAGEKIALPARRTPVVTRNSSLAATNGAVRKSVERKRQPRPANVTPLSKPSIVIAATEPKQESVSSPPPPPAVEVIPAAVSTNDVSNLLAAINSTPTHAPTASTAVSNQTNESSPNIAIQSALPQAKTAPAPVVLPELKLTAPYAGIADIEPSFTTPLDSEGTNGTMLATDERPLLPIPGQLTVSARERASAQLAVPFVPTTSPLFTAGRLLWIGTGFLAAAVWLLIILIRRSRPSAHGSIISRSFDRQ